MQLLFYISRPIVFFFFIFFFKKKVISSIALSRLCFIANDAIVSYLR